MTARLLGWFVRRAWAPVAVAATVGVQHTADMAAATGEFRWQALRVLIAVCALFTGIVTALTPRSTRMDRYLPGLPTIRWNCAICTDDPAGTWHETRCWPTETPGIVVINEADAHEDADDVPWQITHAITGLAIPGWYGSPEAAMAGAALMKGMWDWTQLSVPDADTQRKVLTALNGVGRTFSRTFCPDPQVVNEVTP